MEMEDCTNYNDCPYNRWNCNRNCNLYNKCCTDCISYKITTSGKDWCKLHGKEMTSSKPCYDFDYKETIHE